MTTSAKLLTADDLWNLPDHGAHMELVRGELRPMAPTTFGHGDCASNLAFLLTGHVKKHHLGKVIIAEVGYRLTTNPDTVYAPDIAFVSKDRVPSVNVRDKFSAGAPDLAVEVLSPSDTMVAVEQKVRDYLDAGSKLVWVLNPKRKSATVHRANGSVALLKDADRLDGEDVIPSFGCSVAELFED